MVLWLVSVALLRPGVYRAGLDLKDCFLHWLASPARGLFLEVRPPVFRRRGVYLCLLFGMGSSPGRTDRCSEDLLQLATGIRPSLCVMDSVDNQLFCDVAGLMEKLPRLEARSHT